MRKAVLAAIPALGGTITVRVYPIKPVGQKLTFGARACAAQKVAAHFFAAVDVAL